MGAKELGFSHEKNGNLCEWKIKKKGRKSKQEAELKKNGGKLPMQEEIVAVP